MNLKTPPLHFIALFLLIVGYGAYALGSRNGPNNVPKAEADPIVQVYNSLSPSAQKLYYKQSNKLTTPVPERLVELDELQIGCFGPSNIMSKSADEDNLGGQCCGILKDVEAYEVQLQALHAFIEENEGSDLMPRDPYDMTVTHAQELTQMDEDVKLTAKQQAVYDEAMAASHHGGPCCCKCWKWYVMSGLAKQLIVEEGWNSDQIAQMWDLSSSCGHDEDTNMHQHYDVNEGGHENHGDHGSQKAAGVETMLLTEPESLQAGESATLTFSLKDSRGQPVTELHEHHARKFHVVIVSEDKNTLGHIHPQDFNLSVDNSGEYAVSFTFPYGGKYLVAVDFMTDAGTSSEQFVVEVEGGAPQAIGINKDTTQSFRSYPLGANDRYVTPVILSDAQKSPAPYTIEFNPPDSIKAGSKTTFHYAVDKDGAPVNDLQLFLDAAMHVAVVKDDLSVFLHEHGEFGSDIDLEVIFPAPGTYHLFGQMKHGGQLIVSRFTVDVR